MPGPLTVVIADDHAIFRQALRLTFMHHAKGITVAAEAENGKQMLQVVAAHLRDIRLLDLGMPKKTIRDLHGLSNRNIAAKLSISEKTVTSHLSHVFEKLGVAGRLQAALVYNKLATGSQT